jgi:hypothetical protein
MLPRAFHRDGTKFSYTTHAIAWTIYIEVDFVVAVVFLNTPFKVVTSTLRIDNTLCMLHVDIHRGRQDFVQLLRSFEVRNPDDRLPKQTAEWGKKMLSTTAKFRVTPFRLPK